MRKIRALVSALLITVSLFSGQTMAGSTGHKYFPIPAPDSVLRHNADSDALRARARDAVEECSERERNPFTLRISMK